MVTKRHKLDEEELSREIALVRDRKGHKLKTDKSIGERIKEAREAKGITQETLTKNITAILEHDGLEELTHGRTAVTQWETERAFPKLMIIPALAKALGEKPEYIAFGIKREPTAMPPQPEDLGYVLVPEIVFEGSDTPRQTSTWGLPIDWLRSDLGVTSYKDVAIFKVEVNGETFEFGDRIVIDRSNIRPSPPGSFLHWDGVGANISKMMVVPGGKKPLVKVSGPSGTYDADIDKLMIVGRVKGVWKKA